MWLATTFLTAPETDADAARVLSARAAVDGGLGAGRAPAPEVRPTSDLAWNLLDWLCGCVLIYGALFGIGKIILEDYATGFMFLAVAAGGWRA